MSAAQFACRIDLPSKTHLTATPFVLSTRMHSGTPIAMKAWGTPVIRPFCYRWENSM